MIGPIHPFLNHPAGEVDQWIRDAGHDPDFEEADPAMDIFGWFTPVTLGVEVTIGSDGLVDTVHLHSPSHHGFHGFEGPLPEGLTFHMSRDEVRERLGEPLTSGGPVASFLDPTTPLYWDRWELSRYSLHCEYPDDFHCTRMVTVSRPTAVPGNAEK